ncbi:MAG: hypothetical protein ACTJH1_05680, partial [Corynebacterium variabile]
MLQTELTGEPIVILNADPLEARLLRQSHPDTFRSGARLISGDALQERACALARSLAEVDEGYPFTDSL